MKDNFHENNTYVCPHLCATVNLDLVWCLSAQARTCRALGLDLSQAAATSDGATYTRHSI